VSLALGTTHSDENECDICHGQDIETREGWRRKSETAVVSLRWGGNTTRERLDYIAAIEVQPLPCSRNECVVARG
jgi:hypothetical protein